MNRRLDIGPLQTFCAVADCGSLNKAAQRVNRSQAAVSQQMQTLEAAIGRPLLTRSRQGAGLTAAGHELLGYARRILALQEEALLRIGSDGPAGELRLGLPDDYADRLLPAILARLGDGLPRVGIRLTCVPTPVLEKLLADGQLDLALMTRFADPRADADALLVEPLCWVGREDARFDTRAPLPVAISHHDSVDARAARRSLSRAGRAFEVVSSSPSAAGIIATLRAGLAVAVLSESAVPEDLARLDPAPGWPALPRAQLVAEGAGEQPNPARRRALELIRQALRQS